MNLMPSAIATPKPSTVRLIRSGEVLRITGWSRNYLRKLIVAGVLVEIRHARNLHPWYDAAEVHRILKPN